MEAEARDEALRRLRSIEGHIRGIQRMLDADSSCVDLIRQMLAIKRALDRVSQLLVSSHLRSYMVEDASAAVPTERERAIEELLDILDLSGRL
jgi:DNA-binding FrmR family transcriptional regulator